MAATRIGIIAAVSKNNVIGKDGTLPWHYREDLQRFKALTTGHTIIMGRLTWESLPKRPLPKRRNIVITSRKLAGVECFATLREALASCSGEVWLVGGARLFAEGMQLVDPPLDLIDITYVPESIEPAPGVVYFPPIDGSVWEGGDVVPLADGSPLRRQIYRRR